MFLEFAPSPPVSLDANETLLVGTDGQNGSNETEQENQEALLDCPVQEPEDVRSDPILGIGVTLIGVSPAGAPAFVGRTNGPIRIFPSGFKAVTDQLQMSYRPVTDRIHAYNVYKVYSRFPNNTCQHSVSAWYSCTHLVLGRGLSVYLFSQVCLFVGEAVREHHHHDVNDHDQHDDVHHHHEHDDHWFGGRDANRAGLF